MVSDRRLFVLSKLKQKDVAQLNEDGDEIEAHVYTGIYILEDLVYDKETGRASLPNSAFLQSKLKMKPLPSNLYNNN